jgi:hypothetical protein
MRKIASKERSETAIVVVQPSRERDHENLASRDFANRSPYTGGDNKEFSVDHV